MSTQPIHVDLPHKLGKTEARRRIADNIHKMTSFFPGGGSVTVTVSRAGDRVEIETADDGPGLDDEELERIGDRFWRSGRHQNVNGSGLGLSIVEALLKAGGAGISSSSSATKPATR